MFYSQFILAKKGPLGTIWIAAHLERKLRKNQVADTDIGVSVDSILSPEVPIALRLSSHLLLGVVRIYSRKVNYLFHDCSEALLKVKQAFRSTAVDLPPEESTAPYHSITLPETFDLDDFELPDSEFFQGNYVDHHVSTREQITLQDTMDAVVYSTSQFGLDERFGDGDTSQIGLDLDEELFLDKVSTTRHTVVLMDIDDVDLQASGQAMTPFPDMDIDDEENKYGEDRTAEADASGEQIDSNLHDQKIAADPSTDYIVCASNFHSGDENKEVESSAKNKTSEIDCLISNAENGSLSRDLQVVQHKQQEDFPSTTVTMDPVSSDLAGSMSSPTSVLAEQVKPISPASECLVRSLAASDSIERAEASRDGAASPKTPSLSSVDRAHAEGVEPHGTSLVCTLEETCGKPPPNVEGVDANSNLDCQPVSEGMPEIDCVSHKETFVPQASVDVFNEGGLHELCSPGHAVLSSSDPLNGAVDAHEPEKIDGNTGTETEDGKVHSQNLILRACNSLQTQSLGDENLRESGPDSPCTGVEPGSSQTLGSKEALQASGTSSVVEGEDCRPIGAMETFLEANNIMEPIPSDAVQVDFTKSNEHLDADISEDNHTEINCPTSSDLPAPEIMLSAQEAVPDVPSDLLAASSHGKDVSTGLEGSADGFTVYKRKRRLMESTPVLPDENTANLSGVTQPKRIVDSVPDDDDLLSSILVGRRSSILKMKPSPPQPEIPSSKRRRVAPRVGTPKRKVLLDDTMVLHGDTIRQQLTSTEDIRRMRRKAPCTRPEIWMIQKNLLEDEIFSEPLFTGMTADLIDLHNGTFDISKARVSKIDSNHTTVKEPDMGELSISADIIKEDNVVGTGEPVVVGRDGDAHEPAETLVQTENHLDEEHLINSAACENQEKEEAATEVTPLEFTNDDQLGEVSAMEVDKPGNGELLLQSNEKSDKPVKEDALANETGDEAIYVTELNKEELLVAEGASIEKEGSCIQERENGASVEAVPPNIPQEDQVNVGEGSSSLITIAPLVDCSLENGTYVTTDASTPVNNENPPSENASTDLVVETNDHAKDGLRNSVLEAVIEDEIVTENVRDDGGNYEESQRDSLCALEINGDVANVPLGEGENPGCQEANLERNMDTESTAMDADMRDPVDFGNTVDENDTEFLNFDDDEVAEEEEDNGMPNSDEPRLLENSGWSSRTRAVAKYLQILFDKESGQGKKVIPVDNLLSGKTRKEASRMFFETLVLKTRDYINVEQEKPFDNINIKPRVKLTKSDF